MQGDHLRLLANYYSCKKVRTRSPCWYLLFFDNFLHNTTTTYKLYAMKYYILALNKFFDNFIVRLFGKTPLAVQKSKKAKKQKIIYKKEH